MTEPVAKKQKVSNDNSNGISSDSNDPETPHVVEEIDVEATPLTEPEPELLWVHSTPKETQMWAFMQHVNEKFGLNLRTWVELYKWSCKDVDLFWKECWGWLGVKAEKKFNETIPLSDELFPRPDFFAGSLLNFAENLLYPANTILKDTDIAIIEANEVSNTSITWADLRDRVRLCSLALRHHDVKPHDRVAGFLGNHANTVIAMLAAASIGAIWTGVSPDTGVTAVLDRLVQIEPKVLFLDNAVRYNGKVHGNDAKVRDIVGGLTGLEHFVVFQTVEDYQMEFKGLPFYNSKAWSYEEFVQSSPDSKAEMEFTPLPPAHPVYILYSSGTTGKPKCIVHGSAGTLLQHKKEHILHCDIRPLDRLFYFTTCTWMMWHWLVSGLASGATIVLYDGSPFQPNGPLSMPELIDKLKITHFGTSAKYLSILEQKNCLPMDGGINLSTLKAIYSTGSPLPPSTFRYVYKAFPKTINLGSITGGTDIISLFGAPNPLIPVYTGEIQAAGLGMAIAAYDPSGKAVEPAGEAGDLVCTKPFVSQPVNFYGPSGEAKYKSSYFEEFPGVWHHGDFIRINPLTGGLLMLGRSDGILKPSGVRFGSAEIYNILQKEFASQVQDALCIGRRRETDDDEVVVLFLKMNDDKKFEPGLVEDIKSVIRKELSSRHVPGVIEECFDIPITGNGKKIEVAVKQILCGMNVKTSASVANAQCLDWYREWAANH